MTEHVVRSWTYLYDAIESGIKKHDLRKNDRNYKVGDTLVLQRYDQQKGEYTGKEMEVKITYITGRDHVACAFSSAVLPGDYVILSIERVP